MPCFRSGITPGTENGTHLPGKVFYPRLAASLMKLIDAGKTGGPLVRLATTKKAKVVLSRKGRSRTVTVGDGKSTTYGTLNLDTGEYIPVKDLEGLAALLEEADVDLGNTAIRYGRMKKTCSYCGRALSNPNSMQVGYGPKCAKKHHRVWPAALTLVPKPKTPDSSVDRKPAPSHSNERISYKCGCGAEIDWQIVFTGMMQITPVPHNLLYPGLTATLSRLIEASKHDHLRFHFATAGKANVVLVWSSPFRVVSVTDGGSKTYGRLTLETGEYVSENEIEGLSELLDAINADFMGAVKRHFDETGICTFCGHNLTDARSVHAGYGEICADHFGLPWGRAA